MVTKRDVRWQRREIMLALLEFAVMGGSNALKPRLWNDDVIVPSPA